MRAGIDSGLDAEASVRARCRRYQVRPAVEPEAGERRRESGPGTIWCVPDALVSERGANMQLPLAPDARRDAWLASLSLC